MALENSLGGIRVWACRRRTHTAAPTGVGVVVDSAGGQALAERFDAYLFASLDQVREITYRWLEIYNEQRPHDSLGRVPPAVFSRRLEEKESSTLQLV